MQEKSTKTKSGITQWTYLQLQYLLELERLNINGLSRGKILEVSKKFDTDRTTVSRFFKRCYEDGLLTEDQEFTPRMEAIMGNYKELIRGLNFSLKRQGIQDPERRQRIISVLVNGLNYQDLQAVIDSRQRTPVQQLGRGEQSIDITGCLDQGRFDVRIAFFQVYQEKPWHLSMADQGFEPLAVVIHHTRGNWLELTIREIQAHSRIDGRMMQGHLSSLKYEQGGMLKLAKIQDGKVRIPLEACQFYQNTRGRIYGRVPVTLSCSVGQVHMPESTALLRFWL